MLRHEEWIEGGDAYQAGQGPVIPDMADLSGTAETRTFGGQNHLSAKSPGQLILCYLFTSFTHLYDLSHKYAPFIGYMIP